MRKWCFSCASGSKEAFAPSILTRCGFIRVLLGTGRPGVRSLTAGKPIRFSDCVLDLILLRSGGGKKHNLKTTDFVITGKY
uniref:Uncharacterized protein n=1 Tax=Anguilla anguilla TaxID=7936 RepID=A0A0E9WIZ1_ANGAN